MFKQQMPVEGPETTASTPEHWAATFAQSSVMTARRRHQMKRSVEWTLVSRHIRPGSSVLDAGCGFGEWIDVLNDAGYEAAGLDYSKELIARLQTAYPRSRWIHGDIRHIPVDNAAFDAIVTWGVIEHDEAGPAAALREFARVLRPGGVLIASVPLDSPSQRRASTKLFPESPRGVFFQYAMTAEELASECRRAGFDIVETGTIPGAALALMAPRAFLWSREHGRLGSLVSRAGGFVAAKFRAFHLMTYVVARKR
jgi:SAM-dependent methyltransferase